MSKQVRVAVVGGGIGGLCLAQGLRKAGVEVAVYERDHSRTDRLQGYRIHINPAGARALHECLPPPLWEAFLATTGKSGSRFGFLTEQLDELVVVGDEEQAGPVDPTRQHHSVSRITLHQVLSSGLDEVIHYGKRFERYDRAPNGTVTLHFEDGTTAEADVLVAADGGRSRVREQYLPDAERIDVGVVAVAGKLTLDENTAAWLPERLSDGPNLLLPPKGVGMFLAPHDLAELPVANGIGGNDHTFGQDSVLFDNTRSYLMWAFAAAPPRYPAGVSLSDVDGERLRDVVGELISDWHPVLRRMVADSAAGTVSLLPIRSSVPVEAWQSTNITLIGDAIHSMTPMQGIGANTALRDAELLCRNLVAAVRGNGDIVAAIADYEQQMIKYGFKAVRDSMRSAKQFVSESSMGRSLFKGILRLIGSIPALKRRVFRQFGAA